MNMGKALIGLLSACALLALLLLRGGDAPEPLSFVQPAERGRTVEASALAGGAGMQAWAAEKQERRAASGNGGLRVVHAEDLAGMQGCRLRIDGGEVLQTEGDGAVPERKWPVGSVLRCEVDVDGDGKFDETLTHRVGGDGTPLAIGGWTTFEFEQMLANREAHPIDSVGWSKRLGSLKVVGGTRKPREPLAGSSRSWLRIPATHLSLRSDWVVVARSRAVVDVEHMQQRYGLQVIHVNMVPLGSLRVNIRGGEPLELQGDLCSVGPEEGGTKVQKPRWGVASDIAQWRQIPVGLYELRLTSLSHEEWRGWVQIEVGRNDLWVDLEQGELQTIRCTVDAPPGDPNSVEKLRQVELVLIEGEDRWKSVVLHAVDADSSPGHISCEGPAIRKGAWTVEQKLLRTLGVEIARQEWTGQVLRFGPASPAGDGSTTRFYHHEVGSLRSGTWSESIRYRLGRKR